MTNRWPGILRDLLDIFDEHTLFPHFTVVPGAAVPPPYHGLLVHENHMTVALERYHGGPVEVRVLREKYDATGYARRSLLALRSTGRVVQHCTMRIDLRGCSEDVRCEVLGGQVPLGTVLIRHDVLRRIEPGAYLQTRGAAAIMQVFGLPADTVGYGRVATIHTDGRPTVELLEIVAPEPHENRRKCTRDSE